MSQGEEGFFIPDTIIQGYFVCFHNAGICRQTDQIIAALGYIYFVFFVCHIAAGKDTVHICPRIFFII